MKNIIWVLLFIGILGCGGGNKGTKASYLMRQNNYIPSSEPQREYVTPKNAYRYVYPVPVAPRRSCFGYVDRNGGCWGNLKKPYGRQQHCYGDFEGGNCSGPVF